MKYLVLFSILPVILATFSYEGYKIYQIIIKNNEEAAILPQLKQNVNYDFLSEILLMNHPIDIMIPPRARNEFVNTLLANKIDYVIVEENVENKIKVERERLLRAPKIAKGGISFTEFHRYPVVEEYLNQLAINYPNIVVVEKFGVSLEGRPLSLIRIGTGSSDKPTVLIESTIHAREWIAVSVTTYIIHQLVENPDNRQLIEDINWVIIPVLNPDGYEFSFTNQRMWRKTRRPGLLCFGVDGNRNFDFQWGGTGASWFQCAENFRGPSAFSEPEVAAFRNVTLATNNVVLYLSMHSFGNWLLFPWGWTTQPIGNHDELQRIGEAAADAIASVNGTRYTVGSAAQLLYYAAGNSQDWIASIGVPLSYTIELPAGPGGGLNSFVVPPERIIPIAQEFWPGVVSYANSALEQWRWN